MYVFFFLSYFVEQLMWA